jgi:hypothetical protein
MATCTRTMCLILITLSPIIHGITTGIYYDQVPELHQAANQVLNKKDCGVSKWRGHANHFFFTKGMNGNILVSTASGSGGYGLHQGLDYFKYIFWFRPPRSLFGCVKANPSLTRYMPSKIPHSQHVVPGDPRAHFCHHLPARSQWSDQFVVAATMEISNHTSTLKVEMEKVKSWYGTPKAYATSSWVKCAFNLFPPCHWCESLVPTLAVGSEWHSPWPIEVHPNQAFQAQITVSSGKFVWHHVFSQNLCAKLTKTFIIRAST